MFGSCQGCDSAISKPAKVCPQCAADATVHWSRLERAAGLLIAANFLALSWMAVGSASLGFGGLLGLAGLCSGYFATRGLLAEAAASFAQGFALTAGSVASRPSVTSTPVV